MSCSLQDKLIGTDQGVYVIGTTPPKMGTDDEVMSGIADKLLERLERIAFDGIIVYDIQDESTRIDTPRPFPFAQTRDPRHYAKLLHEKSGCGTITYNSVAQGSRLEFEEWLDEIVMRDVIREESFGDVFVEFNSLMEKMNLLKNNKGRII